MVVVADSRLLIKEHRNRKLHCRVERSFSLFDSRAFIEHFADGLTIVLLCLCGPSPINRVTKTKKMNPKKMAAMAMNEDLRALSIMPGKKKEAVVKGGKASV